jgi:ATP-binding protein involved in chromosome partitioning
MIDEVSPLGATVRRVIAVASGKGGVGKSTLAVNLAVAMSLAGLKVGLLDADVYGPSVPRLLGLTGKPELDDNGKLRPLEAHGLRMMSIGNLVAEEAPVIWRGPMVHGVLRQMLADVAWGEMDVLVIDMPPGTGDAPLTLAKLARLSGAVIVSTPQDVALADARKAIGMFQKLDVPILGIVENMSAFVCPHCGERSEIFGHGGARREAERLGVPFLGEIPLDAVLRETSDAGTPIVAAQPESVQAKSFRAMAMLLSQIP